MKAKRTCETCGKANLTCYPVCNPCRAINCGHEIFHYNSNHAKVCDNCGTTITAGTKHVNYKPGVGIGNLVPRHMRLAAENDSGV